jgi:hypothetical protein
VSAMFLTRAELREWSGRYNRDTIVAWLKARKIMYTLDANDWPKVARELRDRLSGLADAPAPAQHSEPDFSALLKSA